jgi:membrane fusion protein (multidrug efflux system)
MALGGCVNARWWLLGAALALACSGAAAQDKTDAVPVEAAKVIAAPLSEQVTAIGTLLSDEAVTISSEIPGRLQEIYFQEGQPIEKGAPLFTLDDSVYQAQLADAEELSAKACRLSHAAL